MEADAGVASSVRQFWFDLAGRADESAALFGTVHASGGARRGALPRRLVANWHQSSVSHH
jgi:hypothetical protein